MHIARVVAFGATLILFTVGAQTPERSPELQALDAFVGRWTFELNTTENIFGPAKSFTGVERFSWLPGGQFLEMTRDAEGLQQIALFGFNQGTQLYTQAVFDLTAGWSVSSSGIRLDKTWIWSRTGMAGGAEYEERCTWTVSSDLASRTARCEHSGDGNTWTLANEAIYEWAE